MSKYVTILGIDPGINNCGFSVCRYYPITKQTKVYTYFTLHANATAKKNNKHDSRIYGNIFSLITLEGLFENIVNEYNPDYIASEDAFYNPRTPNAFISLKGCINSFKRVLYLHQKTLYLIAPKLAKATVATGTADKEVIQTKIQKLPDLEIRQTKELPITEMSEHEADSIGIAYTFIKTILPGLI